MSKSVCVVTAAAVSLIAFAPASAQPRPRYPTRLPAQVPAQTVAAPPAAAPSAAPAAVETAPAPEPEAPRAAPLGVVQAAELPVVPQSSPPAPAAAPAEPAVQPPPSAAPAPKTASSTHIVGPGDTFYAIGRRYGVGPQAVAEVNGLSFAATLRVGQRLALPAGAVDRGPEAAFPGGRRAASAPTPRPVSPAATPPAASSDPQPAQPEPPAAAPPTEPVAAAAPIQPQPAPPSETAAPSQRLAPTPTPPASEPVAPVAAAPIQPEPTPRPETAPPPQSPAPIPAPPASAPVSPLSAPPVIRPAPSARRASAPAPGITPAPAARPAPAAPAPAMSAAAFPGFAWPVRGSVLAPFGPTGVGQRNDGLRISAAEGTSVQAAAPGRVVYAGDQVKGGYGKLVLVEHEGRWFTAYAHLGEIKVRMQDRVAAGQELGSVGRTGSVAEPQLYFEVRHAPGAGDRARPVDPLPLLPAP